MARACDAARYLLRLSRQEEGSGDDPELLTHMRLQKLLYYVQGWSLAAHGKPLFSGVIEAWKHGPVVREVYRDFKKYGRDPIPEEPEEEKQAEQRLGPDEKALIRSVWEGYKQYSAVALRNKTHQEAPWLSAYRHDETGPGHSEMITQESLLKFFSQELKDKNQSGLDPRDFDEAKEMIRKGRGISWRQLRKRIGNGL